MNIKVDFDNIVVKEDKNDFNVKVLMLKGEKGDQGDGEPNVIEKVQVNGTNLPITNKTVNVPVPTIDSTISSSSTNPVQNNAIYNALSNKVDTSALSNYYEISEIDSLLNDKANTSIVDKKPYFFDNVASMKAYNLKDGDYAITKGYYDDDDGGGAEYTIVDDNSLTEDGGLVHELTNGLKAKLIINKNVITPSQFGAKHNGIYDDSIAIQLCLNILHQHNYMVLDLDGYVYYINQPLYLNSTYKATIKNGEIIALSTFELDNDTNKNYLLYLTNNKNEGQAGTFGYATEDLTVNNIKFDSKLIDGLGCLNLKNYLRININDCYFRRYKTNGIYINDVNSHELILNNSVFNAKLKDEVNNSGVGINLIGFDNIFSNLIITGGNIGIKLENSKANIFSKIHTYGVNSYGISMRESSQNTFNQLYLDGKGIYIYHPWLTTFVNCYFLCNVTLITLDKLSSENAQAIVGLKFIGCVGNNYGDSTINILDFPNGNFKSITQSEFDISMTGNHYNNKYLGIGFRNSDNNKLFLNSQTQTILLNGSGVITNATSMSGRYTGTIINNIVDITEYNSSGYTWAGLVISLENNTNYKTINLFNHNQNYRIYGFENLDANTTGTLLKNNDVNDIKYEIFNSGNYNYYVLAFYGKQIVNPEISTL